MHICSITHQLKQHCLHYESLARLTSPLLPQSSERRPHRHNIYCNTAKQNRERKHHKRRKRNILHCFFADHKYRSAAEPWRKKYSRVVARLPQRARNKRQCRRCKKKWVIPPYNVMETVSYLLVHINTTRNHLQACGDLLFDRLQPF